MIDVNELKVLTNDLSVLYVEDDMYLREDTGRLLSRFFNRIHLASNGFEGITAYKNEKFDIVITDIVMPEQNGIEMIKQIKEIDRMQSIIITSAYDDAYFLLDIINLGINYFILKPLHPDQFLDTMYKVCQKIDNERKVKEFYSSLEQKIKTEIEKRIASEELMLQQSKLASMGEMLGVITHQWKQPLNSLSLIAEDILETFSLGELDKEYLFKSIDEVFSLISFMSKTIEDFKDFLKPSKSQGKFNIHDAIFNTIGLIGKIFQVKRIDVRLEGNNDAFAYGNLGEFKHVILNILSNAKDAILDRRIPNGWIIITVTSEERGSRITFADNAGGIADDSIEKVFEAYYTTKMKEGSGMGLYMSRIIIEGNMHGRLSFENRDDGTVFIIELPGAAT